MTTASVRIIRKHSATCPGCLGDSKCWVCLGAGKLTEGSEAQCCHRCHGSGVCIEQDHPE